MGIGYFFGYFACVSMEIEDKEGTQKDDKIKREKGRLGRQK